MERKNEVAVTLFSFFFSPPNEVSHWQAACESGRVWLRLLQSGGFRNLQGFAYAVVQPNSKRGSGRWYRCGGFNACQRRPAGWALDGEEVDVG